MIKGILKNFNDETYILDDDGKEYYKDRIIWDGYIRHWAGQKICCRELKQKDYDQELPIIICWPDTEDPKTTFVDLYYNERLVKYFASMLGHTAINVNGKIFNFSHLINENEIMSKEEYFYRPAIGEFAPSPNNKNFEILDNGQVFYDKFGRNFMRSIHRIRVIGIDTDWMMSELKQKLHLIINTSPHSSNLEKYRDFNFFSNNCATIIRDVFNNIGYKKIKGNFPRELFISAAYHLSRANGLKLQYSILPQLKVPEAPFSIVSPILNPFNYFRLNKLRKLGLL
tara:strand:- start:1723 stop:2574 length:852 start_codon:yes stop_codon:yes gene_type:complete